MALEKFDEAVRDGEQFLGSSSPAERQQSEWLEVAYRLTDAYQHQLKEPGTSGSVARRIESKVRELLTSVASGPNEFQRDARRELASLTRGAASGEFKDFAAAFTAGKAALELMNSSLVAAKVAQQNNPEAVGELEQEAAAGKGEARQAFERALELAERQTAVAELNVVRYYLAWLYWDAGRIEDAAVLGEFVASRYPDSEYGPGAAKIALAAWEKLYQQSRAGARRRAAERSAGATRRGGWWDWRN